MFSHALSEIVLVIAAATLFYAAFTDLRKFKIPNELIMALVALFVAHALLSGRWVSIHWNLALALLMFAIMLYFYAQNFMGGGDVKILTVAFLWVGLQCALLFAVLLLVFVILHVIAGKLGWAKFQRVDHRSRIPFAPAVAAALIGTFISGCLEPPSLLTQLSANGIPGGSQWLIRPRFESTAPVGRSPG